jgi:predicted ATPase
MNKLGFKNFRRFIDFPALELGDINILVGANNSGKSTFVKAAMLVMNFLKNAKAVKAGELPKFYFSGILHVNIDTFDRALCDDATDNTITFSTTIEDVFDSVSFDIVVHRDADKGDRSYGNVEQIICTLEKKDEDEIKTVMFQLTFDFEHKQTIFNQSMDKEDAQPITLPLNCDADKTDHLILSLLDDLISYADENDTEEKNMNLMNRRAFVSPQEIEEIKNSIDMIDIQRSSIAQALVWPIEYIYAHGASQSPLFDTKNLNDVNAKVVEQFYKISGYRPVKDFVSKWLKEFEVGSNFSVDCIEGSAYKVSIKKGKHKTNLGDMGMGSIQIVILIMHIAEIINELGGFYDSNLNNESIIFIEEPEQNLHPALQSKLADFFADVVANFGGRYIIETHSEYLVRRSQVLVALDNMAREKTDTLCDTSMRSMGEFKEIREHKVEKPLFEVFSVTYFDKDGQRSMKYQKSGRFDQSFGPGFFDEAGKSNMRLIAIRKGE